MKIIKMKPSDVNFSACSDSGHENNKQNPKSKVGDCVRTCKKKKKSKNKLVGIKMKFCD